VRFARQLEAAIGAGNWQGFATALTELLARPGAEPLAWSALIKELVQQIDAHHAGLTPAKKRESIEHVLAASSSPELLYSRLQSALRSWSRTPVGEHGDVRSDAPEASTIPPAPAAANRPPLARRSSQSARRGGPCCT
jgi:diguanylate cyclase